MAPVARRQVADAQHQRRVGGAEIRIPGRRAEQLGAAAQVALDQRRRLDGRSLRSSATGSGRRGRTGSRCSRDASGAAAPTGSPPRGRRRMPMLAQPIMVSRPLRAMNSASAPHSARITHPERHSVRIAGAAQLDQTRAVGAQAREVRLRSRCRAMTRRRCRLGQHAWVPITSPGSPSAASGARTIRCSQKSS